MTDKYIKIENDIVTNVINGRSDGYVQAKGDLANAQIGDTIKNGTIVPPADTRTPLEICHDNRKAEYKPFPEQFDMMYWDKKNGTKTWEEHIDAVKRNNPLPKQTKGAKS